MYLPRHWGAMQGLIGEGLGQIRRLNSSFYITVWEGAGKRWAGGRTGTGAVTWVSHAGRMAQDRGAAKERRQV